MNLANSGSSVGELASMHRIASKPRAYKVVSSWSRSVRILLRGLADRMPARLSVRYCWWNADDGPAWEGHFWATR